MTEHQKRTVTIFTIVASLLPSLLLIPFPDFVTLKSVSLYASAIIGYMGITLLLWMYILGTKSVTSLVFTDIAPVLSIHKWLGKYGSMAIFLHPLLIAYSYGKSWLFAFTPGVDTVAERHILLGQIAFWVLLLTWLVSAFLRKHMAFRPWKYLHYLAYVCIPFALLHVPDLGSNEMKYLSVKAYLFALGLTFVAFSILRLRSLLNLDRTAYRVVQHTPITMANDFLLKLAPMDRQRISPPRRGQYVYIKLGLISEDHPFSVTRYDAATGEITLAYRVAGMYTKELVKLTAGVPVYLSGPFGSFTSDLADTDETPVVYVAGGIGVTPFVDRIVNETTAREQWLFAANRTRASAVMVPQLRNYLGERCVSIYSAEQATLGPGEERGYISSEIIRKYLADPSMYRYYVCGPPSMVTAVREVLYDLDVPKSAILSEKFGW